jgi:hypothetical protein
MTYAHPFNGIDSLFHIKDKKLVLTSIWNVKEERFIINAH